MTRPCLPDRVACHAGPGPRLAPVGWVGGASPPIGHRYRRLLRLASHAPDSRAATAPIRETRPRRPVDDRGIAALELAMFSTLFLLLAFGALPLYSMGRASQRVGKSSSATLRYATSVASNGTRTGGVLSRRPSFDQIQRFARDTANDPSLVVVVTVCKSGTCTDIDESSTNRAAPIPAVAGDTVRLHLHTTVDMSVLGTVANALSRITGGERIFPENDVTIAATADAREE